MKKISLMLAIAAAIALTACGGSKKENVETKAAAAQETQAAAESISSSEPTGDYSVAALPEEYEQVNYEGIVSDYTGSYITIDGADGSRMFDLNGADMSGIEEAVIRGCYVEVSYADAAENGTYPADGLSLLNDNEQLAQEEDRDPVIYGKLQYADANELEIVDDAGRTIEFDNVISRTVSFAELQQGDDVVVSYAGTINTPDEDEETSGIFDGIPVAIKIVAADAVKTEDGEANYIEGSFSNAVDGRFTVSTELADFNCSADEPLIHGINDEERVRVYYTGALSDIVLDIDRIDIVG